MANFAHYFNSRFAGCRLLALTWDHCRNREVKIYQIPGHVDAVGVSDGVDRWVAPVAPELFSVDIQQVFRNLHDGIEMKLPIVSPKLAKKEPTARRTLLADAVTPAPRTRRALI